MEFRSDGTYDDVIHASDCTPEVDSDTYSVEGNILTATYEGVTEVDEILTLNETSYTPMREIL